jgi:hypothetical protein
MELLFPLFIVVWLLLRFGPLADWVLKGCPTYDDDADN